MSKQKKDQDKPAEHQEPAAAPAARKVIGHQYDVIRARFVAITEDGPIPEVLRSPPASRIDC